MEGCRRDLSHDPRGRARHARRAAFFWRARPSGGAKRRGRRARSRRARSSSPIGPTGTAISASSFAISSSWTRRSPPASGRLRSIRTRQRHSNLGVLLRAQGRDGRGGSCLSGGHSCSIRSTSGGVPQPGILLNSLKRTTEAVACFYKVITLSRSSPRRGRLLALAHCNLGEVDKAVAIFEEWLEEEPDNPIARHMLRRLLGPRCPGARLGPVRRDRPSTVLPRASKPSWQALVPRAGAGGRDAGGLWSPAVKESRRARCRLRHRVVRCAASRRTRGGSPASISPPACSPQAKDKNIYDELLQGRADRSTCATTGRRST